MQTHIKTALAILLFTLPLLCFGISLSIKQTYTMSKGNYFFQKTRDHTNINSIRISFPTNNTITITQKEDGLWHIQEADGYYASIAKINTLVNLIRNLIIYRADKLKNTDWDRYLQNSIRIESLDSNGVVDNALIAPQQENQLYRYAILNNDNFLYQIRGNVSLSSYLMDWVQMPLLKLENKDIKRFKSHDFEVYRRLSSDEFISTDTQQSMPHIARLIGNLWHLGAIDVKNKKHFNPNNYKLLRQYEITLFNGIICKLDIYGMDADYWIHITMNNELLIAENAKIFLRENKILYDDWYFQLSPDIGEAITSFAL